MEFKPLISNADSNKLPPVGLKQGEPLPNHNPAQNHNTKKESLGPNTKR